MEPVVAAAAVRAADLAEEEWLDLIPALPMHARGLLRDKADMPPPRARCWPGWALPNAPAARQGAGSG
jgi:hypothetical protein